MDIFPVILIFCWMSVPFLAFSNARRFSCWLIRLGWTDAIEEEKSRWLGVSSLGVARASIDPYLSRVLLANFVVGRIQLYPTASKSRL